MTLPLSKPYNEVPSLPQKLQLLNLLSVSSLSVLSLAARLLLRGCSCLPTALVLLPGSAPSLGSCRRDFAGKDPLHPISQRWALVVVTPVPCSTSLFLAFSHFSIFFLFSFMEK